MPENTPVKAKGGMDISLLITGLLALIDYAEPRIREALNKNEISADEQQALKDRIEKLRSGGGFDTPEWQPSTGQSGGTTAPS
jgi:hypothetical protein